MGIFKDLSASRQQRNALMKTARSVQGPTLKDALALRHDPSKAFQAAPDFSSPTEIPTTPATARIVATRPTALFKGDDPLVVVSLVVVPDSGAAYAVAVESPLPDAVASRCAAGATVQVHCRQDEPMVVRVDWEKASH
jgi:hypothetical protein